MNQYYLRAQYYNQSAGRFTQQDAWIGIDYDPVTLHKYLYINADPINYTDPTGHFGLASLSVGNNIRGVLFPTATHTFRKEFTKAVWGEVKDFAGDQITEAAFGVIGEYVVGQMVQAVDGVAGSGKSPQAFGSTAYKRLDDAVKESSKTVNKYLRKFNARIDAEIFRDSNEDRTSNNGKNRSKGSMGIDVTVVNRATDKVILAFDLKTGKRGTSKRKLPGYRRSHNNSPIIDVFVSRKQ